MAEEAAKVAASGGVGEASGAASVLEEAAGVMGETAEAAEATGEAVEAGAEEERTHLHVCKIVAHKRRSVGVAWRRDPRQPRRPSRGQLAQRTPSRHCPASNDAPFTFNGTIL
jgi:hypothetical protein